ncbi:MAG: ArnT family glycosyltransferase [Patescibacteria group bacterium]
MAKVFPGKIVFGFLLALLLLGALLVYRLTETPPGLTVDEAAFGYNGVLLANTGRDENGKFLPFFVLSIGGRDWRQPATQYLIASFFKFVPPSTFTLRLTSVLVFLVSSFLIFYLAYKLLGGLGAFFSLILLATTPIIFIQSHMALDNIMPVPFTLAWLLLIYLYSKRPKLKYLFWAGVALGINFYTYKAMRGIVPVWYILSVLYLLSRGLKEVFYFSLGVFPFFAIIPYLRVAYPGALFGGYRPSFTNVYDFVYPYLASFDPSFLFIKGDATVYHSTGTHGMFLLASLPFFLLGLWQALKKKGFWTFILLALFLAPLISSFAVSVHRASRLLVVVPPYALVSSLGATTLANSRKLILGALTIFVFANFFNFANYYWFKYPKAFVGEFNQTEDATYRTFAEEARKRNLTPFVDYDVYVSDGEVAHFLEAAYFGRTIMKLTSQEKAPQNSILLSNRERVEGMERLNVSIPNFYLHIRN